MRRTRIKPEEHRRIDKFIIRIWGHYDWRKVAILKYFNQHFDFLMFDAGKYILVPSEEDVREIENIRGYYALVRN
jgi:hypothetical protein